MRIGILVIGSLIWDQNPIRIAWRANHLDLESAFSVPTPIYYGRRSASRGNTYTMTFSPTGGAGQAIVVPCRCTGADISTLFAEAKALWLAETLASKGEVISASWGCVGAKFREQTELESVRAQWTKRFTELDSKVNDCVDKYGLLCIPWPIAPEKISPPIDVILATATLREKLQPTSETIANAWVDQKKGFEKYFFENVRHGIRTPEDNSIWAQIVKRQPTWLAGDSYEDVIKILSAAPSNSHTQT